MKCNKCAKTILIAYKANAMGIFGEYWCFECLEKDRSEKGERVSDWIDGSVQALRKRKS